MATTMTHPIKTHKNSKIEEKIKMINRLVCKKLEDAKSNGKKLFLLYAKNGASYLPIAFDSLSRVEDYSFTVFFDDVYYEIFDMKGACIKIDGILSLCIYLLMLKQEYEGVEE